MARSSDASGDQTLLARVADGDSAALQSLFARHHTRVYRFVVQRCGNEAMAEEIANDVFLEVWRGAARFDGRSSVSTWLLGIAYNKARMALRSHKAHVSDDDYVSSIADEADTADVVRLKQDKAKSIQLAMKRLSDDHLAVIDLVYYHEKGLREVASILGIPENTVKTRLFHARKRLAEILIAAGVDWEWP